MFCLHSSPMSRWSIMVSVKVTGRKQRRLWLHLLTNFRTIIQSFRVVRVSCRATEPLVHSQIKKWQKSTVRRKNWRCGEWVAPIKCGAHFRQIRIYIYMTYKLLYCHIWRGGGYILRIAVQIQIFHKYLTTFATFCNMIRNFSQLFATLNFSCLWAKTQWCKYRGVNMSAGNVARWLRRDGLNEVAWRPIAKIVAWMPSSDPKSHA